MNQRRKTLLLFGIPLLLVTALCAVTAYGTMAALIRGDGGGIRFFSFNQQSAQAVETQAYDAGGIETLTIVSETGSIIVSPGASNRIEVEMTKTAWGTTVEEAQALAESLTPTVQETANALILTYDAPEFVGVIVSRGGSDRIDFKVTVPENLALELQTRNGDVEVTGTAAPVLIDARFGDVSVEDVTGELDVTGENGEIVISGLEDGGHSQVDTRFGGIELRDGDAQSLLLSSDNGAIVVRDTLAAAQVTATSRFGSISLFNVRAPAYTLDTNNGDVLVENVSGQLVVTTRFGDITIDAADNLAVDLETDNGQITFSGSLDPAEDHRIKTRFGSVDLHIPAESAFDVDMETRFGSINSEFPMTITGEIDVDRVESELNGGGSRLEIFSNNGNINLSVLAN